jgi:hypothetical protein
MHVLCFIEEEEDSPLFQTQMIIKSTNQSMPKEPLTILTTGDRTVIRRERGLYDTIRDVGMHKNLLFHENCHPLKTLRYQTGDRGRQSTVLTASY